MKITHYDDKDGLLYVITNAFVGSIPVGPVVLVKIADVLAIGLVSVKHSKTPVHIEDIVKMNDRAQDSVQAANEWGSFADIVLKSLSCPLTCLSNSTRADIGRQNKSFNH